MMSRTARLTHSKICRVERLSHGCASEYRACRSYGFVERGRRGRALRRDNDHAIFPSVGSVRGFAVHETRRARQYTSKMQSPPGEGFYAATSATTTLER